jgi:hypothetical protein
MTIHSPEQATRQPLALSLHRPWAWLIIHAGKDIENRTWATPYRGPVILHSARHLSTAILADLAREYGHQAAADAAAPTGFIGTADLVSIHPATACAGQCSPWAAPGGMHWVLTRPRPFLTPVPGPGSRGLFAPSPRALEEYASLPIQAAHERRGARP